MQSPQKVPERCFRDKKRLYIKAMFMISAVVLNVGHITVTHVDSIRPKQMNHLHEHLDEMFDCGLLWFFFPSCECLDDTVLTEYLHNAFDPTDLLQKQGRYLQYK